MGEKVGCSCDGELVLKVRNCGGAFPLLEQRRHASGVFFFAWPISTPKHVPLNSEKKHGKMKIRYRMLTVELI